MGKHHWKVEKQPEWYVKAVRKTIAALPGGYAEAADWLDVTENALFNRLRADGDQIFPLGWAMVLQRAAGTHYIADAVAQSAGGVFVSLPEIEEVENRIPFLATVASISPYIGLFGTVWGIMHAFMALSSVKQATLQMVAPGIAEALIATAIGLFAAIPAVLAFNHYTAKGEEIYSDRALFSEEMVALLQRQSVGTTQEVE